MADINEADKDIFQSSRAPLGGATSDSRVVGDDKPENFTETEATQKTEEIAAAAQEPFSDAKPEGCSAPETVQKTDEICISAVENLIEMESKYDVKKETIKLLRDLISDAGNKAVNVSTEDSKQTAESTENCNETKAIEGGQSNITNYLIELGASNVTTKSEKTKETPDGAKREKPILFGDDITLTADHEEDSVAKDFAESIKFEEKITSLTPNRVTMKIVFLGDINVGKTSLINRYVKNEYFQNYHPTIGAEFSIRETAVNNNVMAVVNIYDIAGQERMTHITRNYFRRADGAVVVFDESRTKTFNNVLKWKDELDQSVVQPDGSPIPCLLIGNKWDLLRTEKNTADPEYYRFAKANGFIQFFSTSARYGDDISEAMDYLIARVLENRTPREEGFQLRGKSFSDRCKCKCS